MDDLSLTYMDVIFDSRDEVIEEIYKVLGSRDIKVGKCVEQSGVNAKSGVAVVGGGGAGEGVKITRSSTALTQNSDIKTPNSGFYNGDSLSVAILVGVILIVASSTFLIKSKKRLAKIFTGVFLAVCIIANYFVGANMVFANSRSSNSGFYDTVFVDIGNIGSFFKIEKFLIIKDNRNKESEYLRFFEEKELARYNRDKKAYDEEVAYFRGKFDSGFINTGSTPPPADADDEWFNGIPVNKIFDDHSVPEEERTFEKLLELPVWGLGLRSFYEEYNKPLLIDNNHRFYEAVREKYKKLYNNYENIKSDIYCNQVYIRGAEVVPTVD